MTSAKSNMRIAYLECFAGISGDMLLGALVDAGVDPALLHRVTASLDLGAELEFKHVDRSGIRSLKAKVLVEGRETEAPTDNDPEAQAHLHPTAHAHEGEHPSPALQSAQVAVAVDDHKHEHMHPHRGGPAPAHGRTLPAIRAILSRADLAEPARQLALAAFEHLGRAEAQIHGGPLDSVHFHEVGAVDAIVDIACAAAGLDALGVDRWYSSAINVGAGFVECAHGRFPVPAPATAALLKGMPTYSAGPQVELVTPTGAALLRGLGCDFTPAGTARFQSIGYGAGTRNPLRFPNVLRLSVGHLTEPAHSADALPMEAMTETGTTETIVVLECAVDDLSPQVVAYAAQRALESGALDVMSTPVVMKKGRLGTHLTVLCREADAAAMQRLLFAETTTLGVRMRREQRIVLERRSSTVDTPLGPVRIKTGLVDGQPSNAQTEYEDCRALAEAHQAPLKQVLQTATAAAQQDLPRPSLLQILKRECAPG